jgi:hypothetical protein
MMREDDPARLTDDPELDPWIGDLLRSTGPYSAPPGRKQRVLLGSPRTAARRAPFLLRPAIVLGVLVGCGAFASAALGPWRGWIGRAYERLVPRASSVTTPTVATSRPRVRAAVVSPLALGEPAQPPAPSVAPPPPAPPAPRELAAAPRTRRVAPALSSLQSTPEAETESQLVLEAMRALRLEKNPVRASGLLAKYLERNPNGALAEEALALSIEAAVAHHDGDAAALGARYVRRYPSGPFRALALDAQR